jgi:beta-glucanase (GH16 family)
MQSTLEVIMRRTFKFLGILPLAALAAAVVMGSTASAAPLAASGATGTFTQVFTDQFDTLNTATWTRYNGIPTCCPQSGWAKTHVVATDGAMNILTYPDPARGNKWTSGGVSMARSVNQTYGQWTIRFRMDKGAGTGMDVALRPQGSGTVVDWAEESTDHGADRNLETATLHYGSTRVHAHVNGDFSQWHIMTLQWTPGKIVVMLDGTPWATYTSHVPTAPMHLVMQSEVGTNGFAGVMPNATTPGKVAFQIDYVNVSKYNG